jgi:type IV secretion system protein TrbB
MSEELLITSKNPIVEADIRRLVGPVVYSLLQDPQIQEIVANYDEFEDKGPILIDFGTGPLQPAKVSIEPDAIEAVTRMLATSTGKSLDPDAPFLSCALNNGYRFHAALPPVSNGPRFSIRCHAYMVRPLADFVGWSGSYWDFSAAAQLDQLQQYVYQHKNILVIGATSSGKTTFVNSLVNEIPLAERIMILEDEPELQVRAGDVVNSRTSTNADLKRLVKESLRDRPEWIIVGEVRGPEAIDMLDALSTGHSGMSTVHASNINQGLKRVARLAKCDMQLVQEAIDVAVHVKRLENGSRQITEIRELKPN